MYVFCNHGLMRYIRLCNNVWNIATSSKWYKLWQYYGQTKSHNIHHSLPWEELCCIFVGCMWKWLRDDYRALYKTDPKISWIRNIKIIHVESHVRGQELSNIVFGWLAALLHANQKPFYIYFQMFFYRTYFSVKLFYFGALYKIII